MLRRNFLQLLAALPLVGKVFAERPPMGDEVVFDSGTLDTTQGLDDFVEVREVSYQSIEDDGAYWNVAQCWDGRWRLISKTPLPVNYSAPYHFLEFGE